jgi:hypothetical protein
MLGLAPPPPVTAAPPGWIVSVTVFSAWNLPKRSLLKQPSAHVGLTLRAGDSKDCIASATVLPNSFKVKREKDPTWNHSFAPVLMTAASSIALSVFDSADEIDTVVLTVADIIKLASDIAFTDRPAFSFDASFGLKSKKSKGAQLQTRLDVTWPVESQFLPGAAKKAWFRQSTLSKVVASVFSGLQIDPRLHADLMKLTTFDVVMILG